MQHFLRLLIFIGAFGTSFSGRAQNLPEQQCIGAIPVCQATYTQANSYSGYGASQELNSVNHGCLQSNEMNDVWYIINISTSGKLEFSITPSGNSDYDFGLWNLTGGGCQVLYNGLTPIRCDFAGTSGATGISSTITGNGWQTALNVNAGETYLLNVSNFSSSQTGYTLSFAASTASIFDNQNPHFVAANTPCGISSDTVKVLMSEPVRCTSIAANGSDFTITPAVTGVSIQSASAPNCASGGTASLNINLKLSGVLPNGTYKLHANIGTDTNTLKDNCGNSQVVTDTVSFVVGTAPAPVYSLIRAANCSRRGIFSITPSLPGTYTLTISQGTTTVHTFSNVSGSQVDSVFPGTYTATLSSSNCTLTGTFTVNPGSTAPTVTVATTGTCGPTASGTATATPAGGISPYTYSWNTIPVRTTQTVTNLGAGTYTVTVTDSNSCTASASGTVVSGNGSVVVSVSKTDVTCNGLANGTATATPTSGTSPYTYSWTTAPTQTTQTATGLAAGSYTVTVTDAYGCNGTGTATITAPTALAGTTSTTPITCNGGTNGTATYTVSGGTPPYTYSWATTPAQTTATATNLAAGTYTVTVTDSRGCTKSGTATVTQPTALTVTTSATSNPCASFPGGSATANPTGGTPPYTYSWNTNPAQTTQTATAIYGGAYTVTVRDANNCLATATVTVPQNPALSGSFTQVTQPLCPNVNNGSATYAATGGTQPYTYSWNNGQTGPTASGLAAGTYIVSVRDGANCIHNASVNINNGSVLRTTVTTTPVSCNGGSNGTATVTAAGGQGPYTYSWNTTPAQTTTTITGQGAGSRIVTVQDALGCTVRDTAVIAQPAAIAITFQTTNARCYGQQNGAVTATVTGGTGPYTYRWNTIPAQTGSTLTGLGAGTYQVLVTDSKGCTQSATATIGQPAPIQLTTGARGSNCLGQSNGRAYVGVTGGTGPYTYSWSTNPAQNTDTATGLASGTYTVTVTDRNGCQETATATVPTPVPFTATISVDETPCPGKAEGQLTGYATGGSGPYTWYWNTIPARTTQTISGLLPGLYTLTVSDTVQCVVVVNLNLQAHTPPTVSAGPDKVLCDNRAVTLEGSGTATTWSWNPVSGLSCTTCLQPTATLAQQYILSGTDTNGCVASDTVQVRAVTRQAVTTGPELKICAGDSVQLLASGGTRYRWSPAASLSDSTVAMPTAHPVRDTRYRVVISQDVCYTDTLYQSVAVFETPTLELPADVTGLYGSQVELTAVASNATAITWSPGEGLSCTDCFNPVATLTNSVTYTATVWGEGGCTASGSVRVQVSCDGTKYFFPTAFVPEGDGENRWFFPKSTGAGRIHSLKVYNRWGTLMFQSGELPLNTPTAGWDGRVDGTIAPQGAYVYMAEVVCDNGKLSQLNGTVTLLR